MEHAQTQAVRFKGYVRKKGQINPAWKTRFFVLQEDGTCSYYATEAAFEQHKEKKGDFVCRGARLVANAGSDDKNGFLFNVHLDGGSTDDRVIECAVDTAASRDAWVMSLSAASMGDDCVVAIHSDGAASADGGGGQAEQDGIVSSVGGTICAEAFSRDRLSQLTCTLPSASVSCTEPSILS